MTPDPKAPLPDDVEATMARLVNVMANNCYDQRHVRDAVSNEINNLRAKITAQDEKITELEEHNSVLADYLETLKTVTARHAELRCNDYEIYRRDMKKLCRLLQKEKESNNAIVSELEIYRRNDAGGCYSNRTEKETD